MKINQRVLYLSCEFEIVGINSSSGTVTLKNKAPQLKKPLVTIESRFAKPMRY